MRNTSCIPVIPKKTCLDAPALAVSAAKAAAASATKAEKAAKKAEETAENVTPYIGANGNWWRGDTDLGYPAAGTPGIQGPPGETPYIGANGNWWIGTTDTGTSASGSGVTQETLDAAIATRTTVLEVTQEQYNQGTPKSPNIYLIKQN